MVAILTAPFIGLPGLPASGLSDHCAFSGQRGQADDQYLRIVRPLSTVAKRKIARSPAGQRYSSRFASLSCAKGEQSRVVEGALDDGRLQNRCNGLRRAAAVQAMLPVDLDDGFEHPRSAHQLNCSLPSVCSTERLRPPLGRRSSAKPSFPTRSKILSRSTYERKVFRREI